MERNADIGEIDPLWPGTNFFSASPNTYLLTRSSTSWADSVSKAIMVFVMVIGLLPWVHLSIVLIWFDADKLLSCLKYMKLRAL